MRRSRKYRFALTVAVGVSLGAALGDSGAGSRRDRDPVPVEMNFAGFASFNEFRAEMKAERGFYSEARDDFGALDLSDSLEATLYSNDSVMDTLWEVVGDNSTALGFNRACEPGKKIVIGAVGDVLLHQPLAEQGMRSRDGFHSLWTEVEPYLKKPDFMYANLEGPTAGAVSSAGRIVADPGSRFDRVAYTSYPMFNYHPELVGDLRGSGIDVVSTANNHALDRRSTGADRTIENLREHEMPYTGTRTAKEAAQMSPAKTNWTTVTESGGFRIGWVACTFSTNGIADPNAQVLRCFEQRAIVLEQIRRLHADPTIDAVIATPHWGIEYDHAPGSDQRKLAKDMIEAGALIVLGNHPHVLQPVDRIVASDGREGFVIYSLGNFVSGQKGLAKRTSALIYVGLTKTANGDVFINGTRHLPLAMMYGPNGLRVAPAKGNFEEARVLANRILSRSVEIRPGETIVTNPGCTGAAR